MESAARRVADEASFAMKQDDVDGAEVNTSNALQLGLPAAHNA
jgi:hypothetical protein